MRQWTSARPRRATGGRCRQPLAGRFVLGFGEEPRDQTADSLVADPLEDRGRRLPHPGRVHQREDSPRVEGRPGHPVDEGRPDDAASAGLGDLRELRGQDRDLGHPQVDARPGEVSGVGDEDGGSRPADESRQGRDVAGGDHGQPQLLDTIGEPRDVEGMGPVSRATGRHRASKGRRGDHTVLDRRLDAEPVAVRREQPHPAPGGEVGAARLLDRGGEVGERPVAEGSLAQVGRRARDEGLVADVGDQLSEDGCALGVGDAVEVLERRVGVESCRPGDRMRAGSPLRGIPPRLAENAE